MFIAGVRAAPLSWLAFTPRGEPRTICPWLCGTIVSHGEAADWARCNPTAALLSRRPAHRKSCLYTFLPVSVAPVSRIYRHMPVATPYAHEQLQGHHLLAPEAWPRASVIGSHYKACICNVAHHYHGGLPCPLQHNRVRTSSVGTEASLSVVRVQPHAACARRRGFRFQQVVVPEEQSALATTLRLWD